MTEAEWDSVITTETAIKGFLETRAHEHIVKLWRQSLKQAFRGGELSVQCELIRVLNLRHILGVL